MSRPSLVCCAAVLLAGCADTSTRPNTHDFAGSWQYTETLVDVPNQIHCTATGVYHWSQSGAMFDGGYSQSGSCQTRFGRISNADAGAVTAGEVVGRAVRFRAGFFCDYDGLFDPLTGEINGRAVCILSDDRQTLTLTGTWTAQR